MKKIKNVLIVIMAVGLALATFQISLRILSEQRNTVVEIVADYEDFSDIALETGMTKQEMANELISAGVTSIAISEESLADMKEDGKILMYSGVDLKYINVHFNNEYYNVAFSVKAYLDDNSIPYSNVTLVMGDNFETYNFLENSFETRFKDLTVSFKEGNIFCILINRSMDKVKKTGLGLTNEDFEEAKSLGFNNIIPRIENHEGITTNEVDALYTQLKKYKVRTVIFAGVTVFGQNYQDEDGEMLKYIGDKFSSKDAEIITAIIEKPAETDLETVQRGINKLAKYSKYVNTKVFSTDAAQLQKLTYDGLAEQWGRAISQRNVRVIYVRPLAKAEKTVTENFENTLNAVKEIKGRIKHMGMSLGNAKGFGTIKQNRYLQMGMAIGVVSAGFLLLLLIWDGDKLKKFNKAIWALLGISAFGIVCAYCVPYIYENFGDLLNKIIALLASVVFASIAGVVLIDLTCGKFLKGTSNIKRGILILLISAFIAVVGGVYIGAILSDSKYVLKLDTFRGVKISFLLPLLVWGFAYVLKVGLFKDEKGNPLPLFTQCDMLFKTSVTVKYVAITGVVLLALAVIVMRSGNTMTSTAGTFELMFRNFLEKYLVARPRTKELIAFPVLFLVPYLASLKNKEWCFLAMGVSMIGIENVINSFCHIRMPVLITSLSTIYSLIFAIIIGSICIVIIDKVRKTR